MMGRLNDQGFSLSLVKPVENLFPLPLVSRLVVAENLSFFDRGVINPHHPPIGQHQGVTRQALVYDVDLVATLDGGKLRSLNQLPNVINPRIAGRVNLDHIQGRTVGDRPTHLTFAAGAIGGHFTRQAVERLGKDAGAGGLPCPPCPREQIGRGDLLLPQGVAEGGSDRFLPNEFGKGLGAVLVMERFVGHGEQDGREMVRSDPIRLSSELLYYLGLANLHPAQAQHSGGRS